MVVLFNTFYELNIKNVNQKEPIDLTTYCATVKMSVLGTEFRDKLLNINRLPKLLAHSFQPDVG